MDLIKDINNVKIENDAVEAAAAIVAAAEEESIKDEPKGKTISDYLSDIQKET